MHFIIDAIESNDTTSAQINHRGTAHGQYSPAMLLGLLVYSYFTGTFSSRQIEASSLSDVAVRFLCANTHPDHDTLCTFRRKNSALLQHAFAQILELSARSKVLKVGQVTVAIDGTKVLANASKHSAISYAHAGRQLQSIISPTPRWKTTMANWKWGTPHRRGGVSHAFSTAKSRCGLTGRARWETAHRV